MNNINRRAFIQTSGMLVCGHLLLHGGVFAAPAPEKPDIFVIFTDQWSPRETPRWGTDARTPNLDAIAREGMRFNNAYTASPVCMAARVSLLTGQFPHNTGLWGNTTNFAPLVSQARLFADVKAAGYTTAQIGKLHWTSGEMWRQLGHASLNAFYKSIGLDHAENIATPFSTMHGKGAYPDYLRSIGKFDAFAADMSQRLKSHHRFVPKASVATSEEHNEMFAANRAVEYISKQAADKPLFLVVSWFGPHDPMDAPEPYASMYDPASLKVPPNVKFPYRYDKFDYTEDEWRRVKANYLGKITYIDDCVGKVVAALKKRGNWDNTLVIFVSDHGEIMGAHGSMGKGNFHEESVGIPMWVRPPAGIKVAAPESDALVSLNDVYATVVEVAGGKVTPQRFSNSLWPLLLGKTKSDAANAVFSEIYNLRSGGLTYMTRKGDFKWFYRDRKESLYNLRQDPYELKNLINDSGHAEKARELREAYHEWVLSTQINYSEGYKNAVQRARDGTLN